MTARIVVADDHAMVREALRASFERAGFEVVAEAADGEEAVAETERHRPDAVVLDLSMPVLSGAAAASRIRTLVPGAVIVVLSMLSDAAAVSTALAAGARGYVVKDATTSEIVEAVRRALRGELVVSPSASLPEPPGIVTATARRRGSPDKGVVSKREEEVLRVMATGASISEAAGQLYISVKTVKNHLSSIYDKLDSHDRSQAVLKAVRMGLIQLS
ncbi:MAG TPA: response regulator transcription factor [Acidimicrobiales bacterium]|nr:response regulator transcription factor [Acidimicrobiales bacterium]